MTEFDKQTFKAEVGDCIIVKGKVKKVIGYAIGEDYRPCYVVLLDQDHEGWRTYLQPVEKVEFKLERVEL